MLLHRLQLDINTLQQTHTVSGDTKMAKFIANTRITVNVINNYGNKCFITQPQAFDAVFKRK